MPRGASGRSYVWSSPPGANRTVRRAALVARAVAGDRPCAGGDPAEPGLGDADQKDGGDALSWNVQTERELRVSARAQVHRRAVESRFRRRAGIAKQRSHDTINRARTAAAIPAIQDE